MNMEPDRDFVTQRDIARRAGLSQKTVSMALRGAPGVGRATVERVRALAEEMGYVENPLVGALMRSRRRRAAPAGSLVLGWYGYTSSLSTEDRETGRKYDVFAEYRRGAEARCAALGFRLELFLPWELGMERTLGILESRGMEGLLAGPGPTRSAEQFRLETGGLQVVQVGRSLHDAAHDRVSADSYADARRGLRFLREAGHRRVGYVDSMGRLLRSEGLSLAGYRMEAEALGMCDLSWIPEARPGILELRAYLRREKPDALMLGGGRMWGEFVASGVRLPPLAVLGRNGLPEAVTGSDTPHREIGAEAAQRLIDRIQSPRRLAKNACSVELMPAWHVGTSHR